VNVVLNDNTSRGFPSACIYNFHLLQYLQLCLRKLKHIYSTLTSVCLNTNRMLNKFQVIMPKFLLITACLFNLVYL
jgi:hypothetical protein